MRTLTAEDIVLRAELRRKRLAAWKEVFFVLIAALVLWACVWGAMAL